jgi:tetratricopeptide (TPR) repeat protein
MASVRKIFISYRHDDHADFVERIRDWFIMKYGRDNVFMDFDSIPPFTRFADYIRSKVAESDVMMVIIGPRWLELLREKAANFQEDFVRIEVALGIEMGKIIAPICIKDAQVPPGASLPPDLKSLVDYHVAHLSSGRDFLDSIEKVVNAVEGEVARRKSDTPSVPDPAYNNLVPPPFTDKPTRLSSPSANISYDDLLNRAISKSNSNDLDGAISDNDLAIEMEPRKFEAYSNRGKLHNTLRHYEQALADYTHAIYLNPQATFAFLGRAVTNLNLGNYTEAIADASHAIRLSVGQYDHNINDEAHYFRGIARAELEDIEGALADYTEAIANYTEAKYGSSGYSSSGFSRLGLSSKPTLNLPQYIDVLAKRATIYHLRGNDEAALNDWEQIIISDPHYIDAYRAKGRIYERKGELDQAIAIYTRFIENNPRLAAGYIDRGDAYESKKDFEAAIADVTKAIHLDPEGARGLYQWRGSLWKQISKYDAAIQDYSTAIKLAQGNVYPIDLYQLYFERSAIYELQHKYGEALQDHETMLELLSLNFPDERRVVAENMERLKVKLQEQKS